MARIRLANSIPVMPGMAWSVITRSSFGSWHIMSKADAPDADKSRKLSGGVAHSTLGYAYAKQERPAAAIPELKMAAALLKGQDEVAYATALYRLGWAYGKTNRTAEARSVLEEAVKIPGPLQGPCRDLLATVNAARKPK